MLVADNLLDLSYVFYIYKSNGMNWDTVRNYRLGQMGYMVKKGSNRVFYSSALTYTQRIFKLDSVESNRGMYKYDGIFHVLSLCPPGSK